MNKVYAVFKEGVYRHECGGIFSTLEKAKKAAIYYYDNDIDHHHSYDVIGFNIDEMQSVTGEYESNIDIYEPEVIFSTAFMPK